MYGEAGLDPEYQRSVLHVSARENRRPASHNLAYAAFRSDRSVSLRKI
jgi:hypothetical protein